MKMQQENFELALSLAIASAKELDKARGLERTAFSDGLAHVLEASRRGERIEIVERQWPDR